MNPAMRLIKVVFPQPEGPTTLTISLSAILRDSWSRATRGEMLELYVLLMSLSVTVAIVLSTVIGKELFNFEKYGSKTSRLVVELVPVISVRLNSTHDLAWLLGKKFKIFSGCPKLYKFLCLIFDPAGVDIHLFNNQLRRFVQSVFDE